MYTKRMFASKFGKLNKKDLILLDNGNVIQEKDGEIVECENAGIGSTSDALYILKTKSFGRTKVKEEIEFLDIEPSSIELSSDRDHNRENKVAGISVIAGQGPFTSIKFEKTIIEFSLDGKNVSYVIEVSKNRKLMKKLESISEQEKKESEPEDSVEILKKRFARGEISEEEFKQKKDILED